VSPGDIHWIDGGLAMRILTVLSSFEIGGAERTALELVRRLVDGCEVIVAGVKGRGPLHDGFADAAAAVYTDVARFRYDPAGLWRMGRIVGRHEPDVVLIVDAARDALFYGLVGSAIAGGRPGRVCWCKSSPAGQSKPFAEQMSRYQSRGLLDAVVCTSRRQRDMLVAAGLDRRRMPLIRNGVDLGRIARAAPAAVEVPPGRRLFVQVANLMPDKDPATLLAAAGELARRRDDVHFLLVGRGMTPKRLGKAVAEAGAAGVVSLLGERADVPGLLRAADGFVLATRSEVFNVATLEAMAAGLPVVVSDAPGFGEMFAAGREGLRVPPGDPAALAAAIGRLLDEDGLADRLGRAAAARAARFSLDRMSGNFRRLLAALARRRGHATQLPRR
jgi:glycosyltransferase involved in cell wall biosynthesis